MRDQHAPHDEFIERLEEKIGRDVRRRNTLAGSGGWLPQLNWKTALGAALLVGVSMAIGGGVVAAAYQAQNAEQRDQLTASYERKSLLAKQRFTLAQQEVQTAEQRSAVGLGSQDAILDARAKFADAQAAVQIIDLQLAEIRLTTREPGNRASSPLVSGRDFVTERWKIEMSVAKAALEAAQARLASAQQKVQVGVLDPVQVGEFEAQVRESQAGIELCDRRLGIRQQFLKGEYDAAMADLRVLEAEAEQRRKALLPRIAVAQKTVDRLTERVATGMVSQVERGEAQLKLLQLQTELADLDVQVAVVQKQIAQRKK